MAQRLDQLQRIFYYNEGAVEGVDPVTPAGLGTATEFFLAMGLKMSPTRVHLPRRFRAQMGYSTGKIGEQGDPGLSFECELRNRGATNNVSDLDPLLHTIFGVRVPSAIGVADSGSTTCTASSSGSSFTLADRTNFLANQGVMVENPKGSGIYQVGIIDTTGPGAGIITLKQTLSFTPDNTGANVKSMVTYRTADTGHPSLGFQVWLDADNYVSFVGCKGNVSIEVPQAGAIPMLKFSFKANAWSINQSVGNRPSMTLGDTGGPTVALASKFRKDATLTDVMSYSIDLGSNPTRKKSHNSTYGTFSQVVSDRTPTGKVDIYNLDETYWTDWKNETERGLTHQIGSALNKTVAICAPKAQITSVSYGSDSGKTTDQISFNPDITAGEDDVFLALG